ncbi:MAG: 4-hydroxy-tetrahydrodipicolinate synthase [Pseudobacteriovorax sp.]|nr:4-hydroxy-tetrahydrodipicolinate synthase [Pseudobacteriovorax sp.]
MNNFQLVSGVFTAIVTPFLESGEIDWDSFDKILEHQAKGGVNGVVVCGTTGESPTITVQEQLALVRRAKAQLPTNIHVMAGCGGSNTQHSVELAKLLSDAGADSLLVVTPPYNKPSLSGLKAHYKAVSEATKLGLCLYHVPARTGQLLSSSDIADICQNESIVSVKEASGNVALFHDVSTKTKQSVLSGDDPTFLASNAVGGQGVISVVANVFPKLVVDIQEHSTSGSTNEARRINDILAPFIRSLFIEPNPCPLKAVMTSMGLCKNVFRLPMVPVSEKSQKIILSEYEAVLTKIESR